jgi:cytochrome c peroxidase
MSHHIEIGSSLRAIAPSLLLPVLMIACRGGRETQRRSDIVVERGGEVASGPLTAAELARFAPLPPAMVTPGVTRTSAQIALGRRLFHEPVLSNGHDVSCNSCHALNGYGADGRKVSFGDLGHAGDRNAPTVYNAAGHIAQFWDGRAPTVEAQAKGPILNPGEMAMPDSGAVLAHMRASPDYRAAFAAAFPGEKDPITYDNVGKAIGAFERGLVTPSRWDKYLAGDHAVLTGDEQRGLATFVRTGCANCHNGPYVGGQMFMKLGVVKPWPTANDSGRYTVTRKPEDLFVFKVPSLRNVEKTAPYFHDGSVASLDSAIRMMGRHQLGIELSDAQVRDIHTWLGSLTGELPAAYIAEPPKPTSPR